MEIRDFGRNDFHQLASWFHSDEEVVQFGGPQLTYPLDDKQMEAMLSETGTDPIKRKCWMGIQDGEPVGHAQLGFDWRNGNATMQRVAIAPEHRGKKLAAPMLGLVVDYVFNIPEIFRLDLYVYAFNTPAIRTYQSLGFVLEGTRRAATRVGNDRWDSYVLSMLRPEYFKIGQKI